MLLGAERDERRRAQAIAAREEPSLEAFLPRRGDGLVLSASDIETYRTCPLRYKFARVLRIPQEPTLNQRFGILVHQVLERFHAPGAAGRCEEMLGLLDAGWRRGGFADSDEERQLREKARAALEPLPRAPQSEDAEPRWFERSFTFPLGPHHIRGRVDRVDALPGRRLRADRLQDGRPEARRPAARGRPAGAVRGRRARGVELEATERTYYYVLDDAKVAVPADDGDRATGSRGRSMEVARGDPRAGVRADALLRGLLDVRVPDRRARPRSSEPAVSSPALRRAVRDPHGEHRATIVEVGGGVRELLCAATGRCSSRTPARRSATALTARR